MVGVPGGRPSPGPTAPSPIPNQVIAVSPDASADIRVVVHPDPPPETAATPPPVAETRGAPRRAAGAKAEGGRALNGSERPAPPRGTIGRSRTDRSMLLNVSLAALLPLLTMLSLAQDDGPKAEARRAYDRGVTEYNLGRFNRAIVEFERAYELDPARMLLLQLGAGRTARGQPAARLVSLRTVREPGANSGECGRRPTPHPRPDRGNPAEEAEPPTPAVEPPSSPPVAPPQAVRPAASSRDVVPQIDRRSSMNVPAGVAPAVSVPAVLISAELGVSRLDLGRNNLQPALVVPVAASGQYRLVAGSRRCLPSGSRSRAPASTRNRAGVSRALHLYGLLASFGVAWLPGDRFSVGPELAAGILWWSGLEAGTASPWTVPAPAAARCRCPRCALDCPSRSDCLGPWCSYSAPALAIARPGSGLQASIARLISAGVSAGAGVRF